MRQQFNLVLTASFLFLSQGVQGSLTSNDDPLMNIQPTIDQTARGEINQTPVLETLDQHISQEGFGGGQNSKETQSKDLQCYRIINGKKEPLFDPNGKLLEGGAVGSSSISVNMKAVETPLVGAEEVFTGPMSWFQTVYQKGTLMDLSECFQLEVLEWLTPKSRQGLFQTCRYYRAFMIPVCGMMLKTPDDFIRPQLIHMIAAQSGDTELFMRHQLSTFEPCSMNDLRDAIVSCYYKGTLSLKTDHGKTYRSIGQFSIDVGMLVLSSRKLRLVHLDFPGAEALTAINLYNNELVLPPVVKGMQHLVGLYLHQNLLTTPPILEDLPALKWFYIDCNRLIAPPKVKELPSLWILNLDAALTQDEELLKSLKHLKAQRGEKSEIVLYACSRSAKNQPMSRMVNLN